VTDRGGARSKGVSETLIASESEIPRDDTVSFDQLYRESFDAVYAFAASVLRDRCAAEDATSATFERAFRCRNRFDSRRGTARAWLFGIARNAILEELRKRERRQSTIADAVDPESLDSTDHREEDERSTIVAGAVENLCARERELVALKYYAGLSNIEIAEILGISESNVGTRIHRVMLKLREACHATA
jgi:RNA polymerase sigma-70 factor, ECF subfamily